MTDAPENVTLVRGVGERYWRLKAPLETMSMGLASSAEYVRVVPAEEDAGDDARIAAASRREWAERAWRAEAELEIFRTSGIIEVAVRNPSVMDYMKHWEGRAEKAEAERDMLREALEKIEQIGQWGFGSDHIICYGCVNIADMAHIALKGET